jgi:hypothetical protein
MMTIGWHAAMQLVIFSIMQNGGKPVDAVDVETTWQISCPVRARS